MWYVSAAVNKTKRTNFPTYFGGVKHIMMEKEETKKEGRFNYSEIYAYVIVKPQVQGMYTGNSRVQDAIRTRGRSLTILIAFCTSGFPGTARGYCGLTIL